MTTVICFLLWVDFHVVGYVGQITNAILTVSAVVGFTVPVMFLMHAQGSHVDKALSTFVACYSRNCLSCGLLVETARVGFTCGPRVSKTGAAGAFMNKINMTNKHGKSNAATPNDDAHSSNKSDKVIENEAEI